GQSFERTARPAICEPLHPESAPVIWRDLVQGADEVVERVGLQHRRTAGPAKKQFAEIIQRLRALTLLPYDHIRPEPVQNVFIVVVQPTPIVPPSSGCSLHRRNSVRGVLKIAPHPS